MDPDTIRKYVKVMEENNLLELDVEWEGNKLRLRRIYEGVRQKVVAMPAAVPAEAADKDKGNRKTASKKSAPKEDMVFKSPMVGTFFRAPSPDLPPLVEPGSKVEEKTVIGLIEAMKVMNEIKSGMTGTVVQTLAGDGASVEYGQPLFIIRPS